MALSSAVKQQLRFALGDIPAANEVAALIDTHAAGTLGTRCKGVLRSAFGSRADAATFITAVEANLVLAATDVAKLGATLGSRYMATLINAELQTVDGISVSDGITISESVSAVRS